MIITVEEKESGERKIFVERSNIILQTNNNDNVEFKAEVFETTKIKTKPRIEYKFTLQKTKKAFYSPEKSFVFFLEQEKTVKAKLKNV